MKDLIERINNLLTETDEKIRNAEDCGDDIKYLFWADAKEGMDEVIKVINEWEEKQANKTFLDRLKEEREELKERLGKLQDFILSDSINNINEKQANLLRQQSAVMFTYLDILNQRLEDFEETKECI